MHPTTRGFSLVEVLIAIAIFALLMAGLTELLLRSNILFSAQTAQVGAQVDADTIAQEAHDAITQASRIASVHTFDGTGLATGSTTIVLELPAVDGNGTILSSTDYIAIYASGTQAYKIIDTSIGSARTSGQKLLTNMLLNLSFTYPTGDPTQATSTFIDVTAGTTTHNAQEAQHVSTHAYLRNI